MKELRKLSDTKSNPLITDIMIMHFNLKAMRHILGWDINTLSDKTAINIDIIKALETNKDTLDIHHYITLRIVFEYESKRNEILKYILDILFDNSDICNADILAALDEMAIVDISDEGWETHIENIFNRKIKQYLPEEIDEYISKKEIYIPEWLLETK